MKNFARILAACYPAYTSVAAIALVLVLVPSACAPAADQPAVTVEATDPAADQAAIETLMEEVRQADMSSDIDGLLGCYTDDVVSMPPDLPAVVGKEALRAYYEEAFAQMSIEALTLTPDETQIVGDWAFMRGRFEETVLPTGGAAFDIVGKFLFVFHREADGSWKIARLIGNLDGPMPEM